MTQKTGGQGFKVQRSVNARGSAQVKNHKKILDHGSGGLKYRGGRYKRTEL